MGRAQSRRGPSERSLPGPVATPTWWPRDRRRDPETVPRRMVGMTLRLAGAAVLFLMSLGRPSMSAAQSSCAGAEASVRMRTLLEKTIFNVDVLWLTVDVHGEAAGRLRELSRELPEGERLHGSAADSAAWRAVGATCAEAHLQFVRSFSRSRLLQAIRESTEAARAAGMIDAETYRSVESGLPSWYPFLEERGVREGDVMTYRIRGDTLHIGYRSADGEVLLDQTDVGTARSVLAGYFAPGSDFREGLLRSLAGGGREVGAQGAERARREGSTRLDGREESP